MLAKQFWLLLSASTLTAVFLGCSAESDDDIGQGDDDVVNAAVSCKEADETAYSSGSPTKIKVIHISGKAISKTTGHAFLKMQEAAKKAGVNLTLTSGFRTMAEQQRLYSCYQTKSCNNGNLAAKPGYSNHQNGLAVDVSTSSWLANNGTKFGFVRTVPSEAWHWEYRGKDPGGPCTKDGEQTSPTKPADDAPTTTKDAGTTKPPTTSKDAGTTTTTKDSGSVEPPPPPPTPVDAGTTPTPETSDKTTDDTAGEDNEEPETDPALRHDKSTSSGDDDDDDDDDDKDEDGAKKAKPKVTESSGCNAGASHQSVDAGSAALALALVLVARGRRRRRQD
jgi:uncharacterized protein (TIGR03382 family)